MSVTRKRWLYAAAMEAETVESIFDGLDIPAKKPINITRKDYNNESEM